MTTVVARAGVALDCVVLPKVQSAAQVRWLDTLLIQVEKTSGLEVSRIGIEVQIENAAGLVNVDEIATASARMEAIAFGPADFMSSISMKSGVVGEQPPGHDVADVHQYTLMCILVAARTHGLQAVDGPYLPYLQIYDVAGLRRVAARSAAPVSTANGCCTRVRSTPRIRCTGAARRG